ncbi:beta-lactamase family protein, partial [Paracoccaceae bacterium]|nr:beta-lactamase family protein [Paracoccaceae bacterium]
WGYGLMINNSPLPYKRSAESGSWAGVLNTYFWIDPRSNLAGAILMQALPCYGQNFLNAFDFFERCAYKK